MPGDALAGTGLNTGMPRQLPRRVANASFTLDPALIDRLAGAPHPF